MNGHQGLNSLSSNGCEMNRYLLMISQPTETNQVSSSISYFVKPVHMSEVMLHTTLADYLSMPSIRESKKYYPTSA